MDEGITQADLEALVALNVLAAEQLRRIIAERLVAELKAEVSRWKGMDNGAVGSEALPTASTILEG